MNSSAFGRGLLSFTLLAAAPPWSAQDVTGAGATFPDPVYAKWADAYNKAKLAPV